MPEATPIPDGLRVDVARLRRRGVDRHRVEIALPAAWLGDVLSGTDAKVDGDGSIDVELFLSPDGVVVATGTLAARLWVPCGRCLEEAAVDGGADVCATFVRGDGRIPAKGEDVPDGENLSADDLDTWSYDGKTVDLAAVCDELIKLAYPIRVLCRRGENCRGLCSGCGAQLNGQPEAPACAKCGAAVGEGGPGPDGEGPGTGALAEALRKLQDPG